MVAQIEADATFGSRLLLTLSDVGMMGSPESGRRFGYLEVMELSRATHGTDTKPVISHFLRTLEEAGDGRGRTASVFFPT